MLNQPLVADAPAEQLRLALCLGEQIVTQFVASKLHLDHELFKVLANARPHLGKMISVAAVVDSAGAINQRDKTFAFKVHLGSFTQELIEGKFDCNWYDLLIAIITHRKSPVPPVDKLNQWLQPRSPELATIVDKVLGAIGFVQAPRLSVTD